MKRPLAAEQRGCRCAATFCMSFSRHGEIYPSDGNARAMAGAPAHRLDEFPAGYSLAGCAPAWPASASPTLKSMRHRGPAGLSFFIEWRTGTLTICLRTEAAPRPRPRLKPTKLLTHVNNFGHH